MEVTEIIEIFITKINFLCYLTEALYRYVEMKDFHIKATL